MAQQIVMGAEQADKYLPLLKGNRIGLVVNQTSRVGDEHLLDYLLSQEVDVRKVFSPEHGFRGDADAGQQVDDQIDVKTGIPVFSLYGNNKKPAAEQLADLDIIVFDIQDVGVRFYTYISSLHYVMEACAESEKQLLIFDRPNPNGDYVAGPVLDLKFQSFVGMHPIPVVHGCTIGEIAKMINGEGWLNGGEKCDLRVISLLNYSHEMPYSLPIKPSPNLPNDLSIRLYPSLCFFEATNVSIGRGTYFPFQVIGFPDSTFGDFIFTPTSIPGMATKPKQKDKTCYGVDFRQKARNSQFTLKWFLEFYNKFGNDAEFWSSERWFNLLAGNERLIEDIRSGKSLDEIEKAWEDDLKIYQCVRKKYLLYPDFNTAP
ncbi:exo-beta-N-acetylmuramidase NamZ family protein [Sunxiuqinia sp. A32]|uniref:exo-beta-N-acetylmuramidase NamZ family protein n=1 Tax=Sunxiuqinia sp. A32 TaxID=3461496 RepID=UPI0040455E51